jgi:hypothetical protein
MPDEVTNYSSAEINWTNHLPGGATAKKQRINSVLENEF